MDIEWAKDGRTGELFLVQARPETVHAQRDRARAGALPPRDTREAARRPGRSVGEQIGQGPSASSDRRRILEQLQPGEVLVTEMTDPDWEPVMKRAAAVVTNRGGRTCHAAIVSRELGIPAIVGTGTGTYGGRDRRGRHRVVRRRRRGLRLSRATAGASRADEPGGPAAAAHPHDDERRRIPPRPSRCRSCRTTASAWRGSSSSSARTIRAHPMALLRPTEAPTRPGSGGRSSASPPATRTRPAYLRRRLAEGVAMIAAAFWPKDVIVRLSDFKTNEYAGLLGGAAFEPNEENPMIGFRGASRYYDERYREGFALECRAMRKVREEMGLENVKLMVPFCRTVEEGRRVIAEMATQRPRAGTDGLEVYVMCEIPSNVILATEFAEVFDGFSIGRNDLTQLMLGVDRDSEIVAHLFDERNDAVQADDRAGDRAAHAAGRKIGICGQAPSDYPEFAQFLVAQGIDSISLNPDSLLKTMVAILDKERVTNRKP